MNIIHNIQELVARFPLIISLFSAYLFYSVTHSNNILNILKKEGQRTEEEQLEIRRGLIRSFILELLLFVPASIFLLRLLVFPFLSQTLLNINSELSLWYAVMGVIGYGFPFGLFREVVRRIALKTLREFSEIAAKADTQHD